MVYSFKDKIALVTGSSRGIGKAILLALGNKGCKVILHHHRNNSESSATIKDLKSKGIVFSTIRAELRNENEVVKMFDKINKKYGLINILVNNVGNYLIKDLNKLKTSEWIEVIDTNLNSTFYCIHYGLPLLRKSKHGRIINIGYASTGQMVAKPKILPYQIAKTGVLLLTKAYALNEAKNKVLVNMISPGVMENSVHYPKKEIPLKRPGKLNELAKLVMQTLENEYLTGAHIEYAGGYNL